MATILDILVRLRTRVRMLRRVERQRLDAQRAERRREYMESNEYRRDQEEMQRIIQGFKALTETASVTRKLSTPYLLHPLPKE